MRAIKKILDKARNCQLEGNHCNALSILEEVKDKNEITNDHDFQILRAISYIALSKFRNATRCLLPLLSSSLESGDEEASLECFYQIAKILYLQNNFQEAEDLLANLLRIYDSSPHRKALAWLFCLHGEIVRIWNAGKPEIIGTQALELIKKAKDMFGEIACDEGIAECLSILGLISMNLNDFKDAEFNFRKSLELFKGLREQTKAAWQEHNIGSLLTHEKAEEYVDRQMLKTAKHMYQTRNTLGLAWCYYSLGHIHADMHFQRDSTSLGYYFKALDLFEQIRCEIAGNVSLNMGFFEEISDAYQRLASIVAEGGPNISETSFEILFDLAERAKANMLLRQISWKASQNNVSTPTPLQKFAAISAAHEAASKVIDSLSFNAVEESNANKNLNRITLRSLQKQVLRKDEVFISIYCAVHSILCMIVTQDSCRLERIRGWRECCESINRLKDCAGDDRRCDTEYDIASKQLGAIFHILIEKVSCIGKRLIISPDAQVSLVPFDSLPIDGQYPLIGSDVSNVHSASILAQLRGTPKNGLMKKYRIYVDTGTRMSLNEVKKMCSDQFGTTCTYCSICGQISNCENLMFGSHLTNMKTVLADSAECIHIISHGIDGERTGESEAAIVIESTEGKQFLTANEIASMRITTKLVVLSACKSAAGRTVRGEGIESICNAFFAAGAQCVIAALWPIYLPNVIEFNKLLFKYLRDETIAKAFSRAKEEVVQTKAIRRAFQWAPFILYGNSEIQLWR